MVLSLHIDQLRKSDWFDRTCVFHLIQDIVELAGSFGLNTGVFDSSMDEGISLLQLGVASKCFGQCVSEPIEVCLWTCRFEIVYVSGYHEVQ